VLCAALPPDRRLRRAGRARGALFVGPAVESASTISIIATPLEGDGLGTSYKVATAERAGGAARFRHGERRDGGVGEAGDVHGVLLHADGTQNGEPFVIVGTAQHEGHPSVLALSDSEYVVAYELEGRLATRFVVQALRRRSRYRFARNSRTTSPTSRFLPSTS
jgi:hypothetical protein